VNETLAARLEFLLSNLGIKQLDFARQIDFAQSYISMILNGSKTSPSPRFFEAVARQFNVNLQWLRDGTGDIYAIPGLDFSAPDAAELFTKYCRLPPDEQAVVEKIINVFLLQNLTEPAAGGVAAKPSVRGSTPGKKRNNKKNKRPLA
jgi:transcriptional regulator with XRE-family HTH domain